jgi:hypothetical protein
VLKAGYNIGSFLVRYQGIDFRDNGTWTCNDGMASAGGWGRLLLLLLRAPAEDVLAV